MMLPALSSSTATSIQPVSGGAEKKNPFAPMVKFIRNITQSPVSVTPQHQSEVGILQKNITMFQQYSKLAAFPYIGKVNDKDWFMAKAPLGMTKDNQCLTPQYLSSELSNKHTTEGFRLSDNGNIVCSESGLTASVGINYKEKTVAVVFGGTTSGESNSSSLMKRVWKNRNFVAQQSKANLCNALTCHTPKSYSQASQIVKDLAEIIPKDYRIVTVGHSKGAAEAEYAAISNFLSDRPIEAYCFSSAKLNQRSYEKGMSNKARQEVGKHIHHCFVKGDLIPHMGFGLHVGDVTYVPSDGKLAPISAHDKFYKHIQRYTSKN
ncbi:DUF2974 domain-containing protein [Vibrio cholerae]